MVKSSHNVRFSSTGGKNGTEFLPCLEILSGRIICSEEEAKYFLNRRTVDTEENMKKRTLALLKTVMLRC